MKALEFGLCFILAFALFINSNQQDENSDTPPDVDSPNPNGTSTSPPQLYLLGFGNFDRPETKVITFIVFFRKIGSITLGNNLKFTITINYANRLRALEQEEEVSNCYKIDENDIKINYNCSAEINQDKKITTIESKGDFATDEGEINYLDTTTSLNVNIAEQTTNSLGNEIIELSEGVLTMDKSTFTIEGKTDKNFNEKQVTLVLDDAGDKKEVPCKISGSGFNYKLICTPKEEIEVARLENAICLGNEYNFLIHMKNENEVLSFTHSSTPVENHPIKRSKGGLTGGAIAGIVIAIVVVVVAGILTSIFLRKTKPKKKIEESDVKFYESNMKF